MARIERSKTSGSDINGRGRHGDSFRQGYRQIRASLGLALFISGCVLNTAAFGYDYKGIPLGISLSDFKHISYPDGKKDAKVVCTDDDSSSAKDFSVEKLSETERLIGVTKCAFYGKITEDDLTNSALPLSMGGRTFVSWNYEFVFSPKQLAGDQKLFKIVLVTNFGAIGGVNDALTKKFGAPSKTGMSKIQNGMGAVFDRLSSYWVDKSERIDVQGPWTELNNMVVIYSDSVVAKSVSKLLKSTEAQGM